MKVREIMTENVKACMPHQPASEAVRIMWEYDCGVIPVVDGEGCVVGVVTDRDICIACWSQGLTPGHLGIGETMSREVKTCRPGDTIAFAEQMMKQHRVHRLPVTDADGRLQGILSLNDIARAAQRERTRETRKRAIPAVDVVETLATVCEPRAVPLRAERQAN